LAHYNKLQFKEFQAVPPGIFGEKAAGAGQRVIFSDLYGAGEQRFTQLAEIRDSESRMRLFGRLERYFDANVNLLISALEPASAPCTKRRRLFDFAQPENRAVKFASGGLAACWRSQLDVVDASYHSGPLKIRIRLTCSPGHLRRELSTERARLTACLTCS
jgi:hypothetical protein